MLTVAIISPRERAWLFIWKNIESPSPNNIK